MPHDGGCAGSNSNSNCNGNGNGSSHDRTGSGAGRGELEALAQHAVHWLLPAVLRSLCAGEPQAAALGEVAQRAEGCGDDAAALHGALDEVFTALVECTLSLVYDHDIGELVTAGSSWGYDGVLDAVASSRWVRTCVARLWPGVDPGGVEPVPWLDGDEALVGVVLCDCYRRAARTPLAGTAEGLVAALVASGVPPGRAHDAVRGALDP